MTRRDPHAPRRLHALGATRAAVGIAAAVAAIATGCVPEPVTPTTTTAAPTTSVPDPNAIEGAQLSWSYSPYAQYGVFGQWSQIPVGDNIQVNTVDGLQATGLASEAGISYLQGQFDGGTGSIDPVTGEGQITWATGDWVLNAYNGLFGAPDEVLSDPILDIAADGSGTLSFEAYIPEALDMEGNPAGSSGPDRIAIATFSSVELTESGLRVTPDFAGRSYVPTESAYGETGTVSCIVDGVEIGGSWPAEWIDFVPASVRAHYFTTGCSGLNLKKPPAPFSVTWAEQPGGIVNQPSLSATTLYASALPRNVGAKISVTGVPTPAIQWERSFDGVTWTEIAGQTGTMLGHPVSQADDGASYRAVVNGTPSDSIGPISVLTAGPTILGAGEVVTVGRGDQLNITFVADGSPIPAVSWERSDDDGATWQPVTVDGVNTIHTNMSAPGTAASPGRFVAGLRFFSATDAEDGAQFRVIASNGIGATPTVVSGPSTSRVRFDQPSFTTQPSSTAAFVGQGISISAFTTGLPAPAVQWQTSADGGASWTDTTSNTPTNFQVPANEVTTDIDGLLVRVVATSAAGSVTSNAATIRVFERTEGRQLIVVPSSPVDPTVANQFTVIGAGWTPSDVGNLRVGIVDAAVWQPGQPGITSAQALTGATITRAALTNGNGVFRTSLTVPANGFSNSATTYGVATYGFTATDRAYDSWTPISIAWP